VEVLASRWVLPVTSPPVPRGAVAVEGSRVVAVGTARELQQAFPQARWIDCGDAILLPGLVNVHSHLELTVLRGRLERSDFYAWIAELVGLKNARLTSDDLLVSARLGCLEAIRAGVTTLADTSDAEAPLQALAESGLRGVVYQECFGPDPEQVEAALELLQGKLLAHQTFLRRQPPEVAARLRLGVSPHAPYSVSPQLYQRVARWAIEEGLDLALHAAESQAERQLLLDGGGAFGEMLRRRQIPYSPPGCSLVEFLDRLGVLEAAPLLIHGVTIEPAETRRLTANRVRLAHCPKSNAKFGHGVAPLRAWLNEGLVVGLGTDSVASNNGGDLLEEARFCGLLHRAVEKDGDWPSADQLLRLLTIEGARTLHLEEEIGSLEAGKRADLIAVSLTHPANIPDYDPVTALLFSGSGRDVQLTMVDGHILYAHRNVRVASADKVSTLDEASIVAEARLIAQRLDPALPSS
jgi:cytosine/adenosine deaminase-related metal-dependent hydrolase